MSVGSVGGTYGLSGSGIDVDAIVKKLMTAEQTKADTLAQKKTVMQWQKAAYNTVYDNVSTFRNTVFNYKLQATLSPNKVSSSNTAVVTATANAGAANVNHSVVVSQLADGMKMTSKSNLSTSGATVDRTTIASQLYQGTAVADIPKMVVTINNGVDSATIAVDPNGSLNDLVSQINKAGIKVNASYDSTVDRFFLTTANTGSNADISFAGSNDAAMKFLVDKLKLPVSVTPTGVSSNGSVQATSYIDPTQQLATQFLKITDSTLKLTNSLSGTTESISVHATDTLQDVMNRINSGTNATASFNANTGQFSITPTLAVAQLSGGATMTSASSLSTVGTTIDKTSIASQFYQGTTTANIPSMAITINNGLTSSTINVNPDGSLTDFANQINSAGLNVTASYDSTKDLFTITNNATKTTDHIDFTGSNAAGLSFLVDKLKMPAGPSGTLSITGSDQGVKDLFSQLHMPTTFNSGGVTTSKSSVTVPFDPAATLQKQFAEFASSGSFTLKIATTSVTIDPVTDSLNDMLAKIQSAVPGASATYDTVTGKVAIQSASGTALDFSGSDATGSSFLANTLKIHQAGKDAIFNLDGADLTQSSNNFTIADVSYALVGTSPTVGNTSTQQTINIGITKDIDQEVTSIQALVDSYNKILADVNAKVKETRYTEYPPLTDAQKTSMKDSDITAWNLKAQSGMLHNDDTLTNLINSMRNALSSPVSGITGAYKNAASIGITTGDYTEGGKLYLDTTKLKAALNADPNVLENLFGASGATTTNGTTTTDSKSQGIAGRLYDNIKKTMDKLQLTAGTTANAQYDTTSNIAKNIIANNKLITNETTRFNAVQKAYYTQYNAMEVALNSLSSQSSWLTSQLSSSSSG